jgi:hypothetical protein
VRGAGDKSRARIDPWKPLEEPPIH